MNRLHAYLDGKQSQSEFERWFYGLAFDVHRQGDAVQVELVYAIEGILGEASSGHWTETTFKAELEFFAPTCLMLPDRKCYR